MRLIRLLTDGDSRNDSRRDLQFNNSQNDFRALGILHIPEF
jgi:hypothetical protein